MPVVSRTCLFIALTLACLTSSAAAQVTAAAGGDFSMLIGVRRVAVVDDTGRETIGRVLRVTADSLTMRVDGHERTFAPPEVSTVHQLGDPLANGAFIGLLVGGTLGVLGSTMLSDCTFEGARRCDDAAAVKNSVLGATIYGALGVAVGIGIDRLAEGRTLRYVRSPRPGAITLAVAPALSRRGAGLQAVASW